MRIYVASSWRNMRQPEVVQALRQAGHEVYDFRNPTPGEHGFGWRELDPAWQSWTPAQFREALEHPRAVEGYELDFQGMAMADACVLVQPCGRSAHLEAGWAVGAELPLFILLEEGQEPELMYKLASETGGALCLTLGEVLNELDLLAARRKAASDQAATAGDADGERELREFADMLSELGPGEVVEAIQEASKQGPPKPGDPVEKALTDLCVDVFRRGAAAGYELARAHFAGLPPPVTQDELVSGDDDDDDDVEEAETAIDASAKRSEVDQLRELLTRLVNRLPEGEALIDVLCREDDDRETAGELLDEVLETL